MATGKPLSKKAIQELKGQLTERDLRIADTILTKLDSGLKKITVKSAKDVKHLYEVAILARGINPRQTVEHTGNLTLKIEGLNDDGS